jgi:hypothetical protein
MLGSGPGRLLDVVRHSLPSIDRQTAIHHQAGHHQQDDGERDNEHGRRAGLPLVSVDPGQRSHPVLR